LYLEVDTSFGGRIKFNRKEIKILYFILVILAIIGLIMFINPFFPNEKELDIGLMGCVDVHMVYGHMNETVELGDLDIDSYTRVSYHIYDVYSYSSRTPSEKGIHYYFYRTSDPLNKRYEGWVGQNDSEDRVEIHISESGDWILFMENSENENVNVHVDQIYEYYKDAPNAYYALRIIGVMLTILSLIFILHLFITNRASK
jgi:hypothetical protein